MAERQLTQILTQLKLQSSTLSYAESSSLLSKAKLLLVQLNALTPPLASSAANNTSSPTVLALARETYEQGALAAIRARNPEAFTRYVSQLAGFYELPASVLAPNPTERSKVTGLYLLLLLTQGKYAEFHSELEALSATGRWGGGDGSSGVVDIEGDRFLGYPIRLERWLMEGSYDRVWRAMKQGEVPCEEYGVFSEILRTQIRNEIASSSERAYPSLPLSSTKSLLFLDSEGSVIDFAYSRGWNIKDGQIIFPSPSAAAAATAAAEGGEDGDQEKEMSQMVIENTLGYARQLETIV
ncbi:SAC3/GANP/Nin1/mts3/eIF-3 p25 family-domain-containing protein [Lasiosphaeria miniovina]|uniref:SAC3/GANP/Nin1/mts3/eIF-3 p25 family-domain-containing protein n=1 Tax=Lasiosphaeria miniovina TaxID=1954250 RepID=A0AA40AD79_9PEZI|nr:SAC3/GANP/Nin1/mts3/eIF-3 p25 family-domain-containing protein [Lasiosphaeria miniovina]KAK0713774.1 SAC3/GANP/Nin1/mts3/eIF-3 p25 family-domain-containing protein [Lasiosphaeria miniovina]